MSRERARSKRWIVREGDGATVADIVRRAGEAPSAIEQGRVFVGRVRVKLGSERVRPGDEVKIGAAAPERVRAGDRAEASSNGEAWALLWHEDGLLACSKPAGIPTVPDHEGASHALVALAARSIGRDAGELFVTSRLDREVSGVVVFATSPDAEARLRVAREHGRYTRRYVALAADGSASGGNELGRAAEASELSAGVWDAPIGGGKDPRHRAAFGPDAKAARTRWAIIARAASDVAMLAVAPETGRTHQIRVHASYAGAPLLGDRDYGGPSRMTLGDGHVVALSRVALHAARVTVPGARGQVLVAEAPIPSDLARVWSTLGGAAEAWDRAVSCELEP